MNTIPTQLAITVLTKIAEDPKTIGELLELMGEMPNVSMQTMGGNVFWTDVANANGWRLQRNKIFGNCRILDPSDIRRAWGSETAMLNAFKAIQ